MASVLAVDDPADKRLADYTRLTDGRLRRSLESQHGLFIAEGERVIRRAIEAGYRLRSLLVSTERLEALGDLATSCAAPVYVVPADVAEQLTGYHVHRGALASVRRRPGPAVADVLAGARRVVVLEDIVDHANVGSVFRCAAALGFDGVLLAPRCADPLYRRAVRVSIGAVLAMPYARMADWRGGLAQLTAAGFCLVALTPAAGAVPIAELPAVGRLALLLGAEGSGLSPRWQDAADVRARIPMRPGVDSLNVASAAAIACYLLSADRVS